MNSQKGKRALRICAVVTNVFFFTMICSQSYAQSVTADEMHPGIARSIRMNDPQIRADNEECKRMPVREGQMVKLSSGNFCAKDGFGRKSIVVHRSNLSVDVPDGADVNMGGKTVHVWVDQQPPPGGGGESSVWDWLGPLLIALAITGGAVTLGVLADRGYFNSGTPNTKHESMSRGLTVTSF